MATITAAHLVIPGFRLIPGGPCQLGAKKFADNPVRTVDVSTFYSAERLTTNADYAQYVQANSGRPPYAVQVERKSGWTEIVAELSVEEASAGYPAHQVSLRVGDSLRLVVHPAAAALMLSIPPGFTCPRQPVVCVSWEEAARYCAWLGREKSREMGRPLVGRLPREAEWEKAARGPSGAEYMGKLQANDGHYRRSNRPTAATAAVGTYPANGYGLFDKRGNVWEWVEDWYDAQYSATAPDRDPTGPATGEFRGLRGGSWGDNDATVLSAAYRDGDHPGFRYEVSGFRAVVAVAPQDS